MVILKGLTLESQIIFYVILIVSAAIWLVFSYTGLKFNKKCYFKDCDLFGGGILLILMIAVTAVVIGIITLAFIGYIERL